MSKSIYLLAIVILLMANNTFALDEASTISDDAKRILAKIESTFEVKNLSPEIKKE